MKKISSWINKFQYRIGIKYFLFLAVYVLVLTIIIVIVFQYIDSKNTLFALPAIIIGYDRLFSILRKGFNYGISQLDRRKESDRILIISEEKLKFAKLVFMVFYFWQKDWKQMLRANTCWSSWAKITTDFQAVLNNDFTLIEKKYTLNRDFTQFEREISDSYYFKNINRYHAEIHAFWQKKDYINLKMTFEKLETEITIIKKIFQFLFMWICNLENNHIAKITKIDQNKSFFDFSNATLREVLLNNFLNMALEAIEKKYENHH